MSPQIRWGGGKGRPVFYGTAGSLGLQELIQHASVAREEGSEGIQDKEMITLKRWKGDPLA